MSATLVVNASHRERRVALIEKGSLAELYIERPSGRGLVGNIYKGRVVRVLPGMDAAFVDVGLEKAGFLYISDVAKPVSASELGLNLEESQDGAFSEKLSHQTKASSSDRGTDGDLPAASRRLDQHQSGDVGAGDEQHESDGAHQYR